MARITAELQSQLAGAAPEQELDLILEMAGDAPAAPASGRATTEYVDSMRETFRTNLEPVHRIVQQIGGAVMGENWLNRAVKIRVPAGRISELLQSPEIDVIDVPHRLTRA